MRIVFRSIIIYRIVALDLRGCNQSDKPTAAQNYKLETLILDLKNFIEYLGMYFFRSFTL